MHGWYPPGRVGPSCVSPVSSLGSHTHAQYHPNHNLHPNPHPFPTSIPFRRSNVAYMGGEGGSHGSPVSSRCHPHPPTHPRQPPFPTPPPPTPHIFVPLLPYPTLGLLSHRAILILPCTPGNQCQPSTTGSECTPTQRSPWNGDASTDRWGWFDKRHGDWGAGSRKPHGLVPHARRISKRTTGLEVPTALQETAVSRQW